MTWARLDDRFPFHSKVAALSDAAFRVHVSAICCAAGELTDGHVPEGWRRQIAWRPKDLQELVNAGVWEVEEEGSGYRIHDFLIYNRSRADVAAERQKKSQAGSKGADKRWAPAMAPAMPTPIGSSMPPTRPDPTRPTVSSETDPPSVVPAQAPARAKKPRPLRVALSIETRDELIAEFAAKGLSDVNDRIDEALNHKAVERCKDEALYVRGWLRRDLKREQEHPAYDGTAAFIANGNGHSEPHETPYAFRLRMRESGVPEEQWADVYAKEHAR